MTSYINHLRNKFSIWWQKPSSRRFAIITGTILGTSAYYYPIIEKFRNPYAHMTPEQQAYFEKNTLYPLKVQKQRELESSQAKLNTPKAE